MTQNFTHRKATITDLKAIVNLLLDDELGKTREKQLLQNAEGKELSPDQRYFEAFDLIDSNPNQYLMVVIENGSEEVIATCHLTVMPSLTFIGQTRMQIEAVRVAEKCRGRKVGEWMMTAAIEYGKSKGASIIQLTTNKNRPRAKQFYERLGFEPSHEGMKLYLNK